MPPPLLVPFFWYASARDFDAIRAASIDSESLPAAYDDWLDRANKGIEHLQARGRTAFKVDVNAQEFIAWCRSRGQNIDSQARLDYASLMAAAWYRREHPEG